MKFTRLNKENTWDLYGMSKRCNHDFNLIEMRSFTFTITADHTLYVYACSNCPIFHIYSPTLSLIYETKTLNSLLLNNPRLLSICKFENDKEIK